MITVGVNGRAFSVDEPGGAVQASRRFTHELVDNADCDVVLFGHASLRDEFRDCTVDNFLFEANSQMYGLFWERLVLPYLARRRGVDVLFCPNGNGPLTKQPFSVLLFVHDVNAQKGWSSGIHQLYRQGAVPRAARVADRIATVSSFSKGEIVDALDVPADKVDVVPIGVDEVYTDDSPSTSVKLPERYILYVGSLNPRKNISNILRAHRLLRTDHGRSEELVIVGPGNKRIFKNFEVSESSDIVTPGFLSVPELKFAYENAALLLYPSMYEGFGLPPLEAMGCGTPVVASDCASFPEVLNGAAVLVDPAEPEAIADAVNRVLTDDDLYDDLVARGHERVAQFDWKRAGQQLFSTIRDCSM